MSDSTKSTGAPVSHLSDEVNRSVATDAIQDGDAQKVNNENPNQSKFDKDEANTKGECHDDSKCASCHKEWTSLKSKGTPLECSFCKQWHCLTCANMKTTDMQTIARPDIFWACIKCKTEASEMLFKHRSENQVIPCLEQIEKNLEKKLENKIETALQNLLPTAITKSLDTVQDSVSKSVEKSVNNMSKAWAETLLGDTVDPENFPSLDNLAVINAPVKPKPTLKTVFKEAVSEQKIDEVKGENRLNNIIIHGLPEKHEAMQATRINNDNEFVKELLQHIEVNTTSVKLMRLGRYKQPEAGNDMKTRALKVILDSHANQQKIMDNEKYLKDAPAHLKAVSICYDLTEEERNKTKTLMEEAQKK